MIFVFKSQKVKFVCCLKQKKGGFMKKFLFGSFLSIYHMVPKIVESIDRIVFVRSTNSSYFCGVEAGDTEAQAKKILALTDKKIGFINLKLLTEEALGEISTQNAKLLVSRYIDMMTPKKIMEIFDLKRRTYFRQINRAVAEFDAIILRKISTNKSLYSSLAEEEFMKDILSRVDIIENKIDYDKVDIANLSNCICNLILSKIKRAC